VQSILSLELLVLFFQEKRTRNNTNLSFSRLLVSQWAQFIAQTVPCFLAEIQHGLTPQSGILNPECGIKKTR